jgi:LmbE family N-acetylglucosaminyl deacetylase
MFDTKNILILSPHTDDGELGCGAAIAKYIEQGKQVTYIAFSSCSQSLPAHLPPDTLVVECTTATRALGIQDVRFFDFEVRRLLFHRQEILEALIRISQELQPQTVFLPAEHDVHQDHQVIFAEGMRAFKNSNVLGYELPWNNFRFQPTYFERVEDIHVRSKLAALKEYRSQSHRKYMRTEFIQSLATVRGIQSNTALAEAFEVYRLIS